MGELVQKSGAMICFAVVLGTLLGCSESKKFNSEVLETCCVAGEQVCSDGALWVCDDKAPSDVPDKDGVFHGYDLSITPCPSGACSGNDCATKQCSGAVGSTRCDQQGNLVTCTASGTEQKTACGDTETCVGGSCVAVPCATGDLKCCGTTDAKCAKEDLLECTSLGEYDVKESCAGNDQVCDSKTLECVKPQCVAFSRFCYAGSVAICGANGLVEAEDVCTSSETCRDGHCIPAVCGGGSALADAVGSGEPDVQSSTLDIAPPPESFTTQDIDNSANKPDAELPSKAIAYIDGEKKVFSSFKSAAWISLGTQDNPDQGKALQISMVKGVEKLELLVTGLQEGQVGKFDNTDTSVVQVEVRYSDGLTETADPQAEGCSTTGWTSCGQTYNLELTSFGVVGQHVKGNFEATLTDSTTITEGEFDVERNQ